MAVTSSVEPAAMRPLLRRCVAFAPLLLLVLLVSDQNISARTRMPVDMPPLVLWAWDRDDDLGFIDIRDTAVAYLAATVILRGETVFLAPRHHPLGPPKGTRLVAVAHVEVDRHEPPIASDAQARDFAASPGASTNGGRSRWQWTRWSRCCSAWVPIADASGAISPTGEIFARPTAVPASASRRMSCRLQYRPADAFTPSARDAGMPKPTPRCARGYANGQMLLGSSDPRHPAVGSRAYCVGDGAARAGDQVLQPVRPGSGGRSCVFPRASGHPASHLHRQSALRRLPHHAGRALLGGAGQATARALLRCSGDALRCGDELERPAQARSRRAARQGGYVVPTAAGRHAHFRRLMLSERLSQFRCDAARAHCRSRRQQSAGARMGDRPGRRPPQLL